MARPHEKGSTLSLEGHDTVAAVYELREAAVEHGKAVAELERTGQTPDARDHLLETALELETKTVAALDECSENAAEAVETVVTPQAVAR